jgi:hypothetical protein
LYWSHFFEFVAACVADGSQQIDRTIDGYFPQFDEALVGLLIASFSDNIVGALDHGL